MRRIKYCTKGTQLTVNKTRFGEFNPENDVIHDADKVISDMNPEKFADIWPAISPSCKL